MGQYLAHRYTQNRERERLLREKAEELINTLCQIQQRFFVWHEGLRREARRLALREEGVVGNISLDSPAESLTLMEYQDLANATLLDVQRVDTLQRLYFPQVQNYHEAYTDALFLLVEWLESQVALQEANSLSWPALFHAENAEKWPPLQTTYDTACAEIIEAVARTVLPYRKPSRALSYLRRHR